MLIVGLGLILLTAQEVSARTPERPAVKGVHKAHTRLSHSLAVMEELPWNPAGNCIACHEDIRLERHDRLGVGASACLVCHDRVYQGMLRFVNGTTSPFEASSELCAQCHEERYYTWMEGTHGVPGQPGVKCTDCHNPHAPQIALLNITRPHPPPIPPPPLAPPTASFGLFTISLAVAIIVGLMIRGW